MRPVRIIGAVAFVLFAQPVHANDAATVPEGSDEPACFCLMNVVEGYFLIGCEDKTPKSAYTKRASCRHPQTGRSGDPTTGRSLPIRITDEWKRIESGAGTCDPCEYIRNDRGDPDTPRGGDGDDSDG